ncbi:MAG: CHAT domain-containing protein [Pyrinomonadaceae bacterium]|nr:CHAT domain-containing protein [Pyrinomonadaceae bacterium]
MLSLSFRLIVLFLLTNAAFGGAGEVLESDQFRDSIHSANLISEDTIVPEKLYRASLTGGEKSIYRLEAQKDVCLRFIFEQKGIDIMIGVRREGGEIIKMTDRPSGSHGRETVTLVVPETGVYVVEITAWLADAIVGNYEFSYTESTPEKADLLRSDAEDLTSNAELLRGEGSLESKEKALLEFEKAREKWKTLGDDYEIAVVDYGTGFTNYQLSRHYEAARSYTSALEIHMRRGDDFGKAVNFSALGAVKFSISSPKLSVFLYRQAIEIYKKLENFRGLGIAFHGLGSNQMISEEYAQAVESLHESLRYRAASNDSRGAARTRTTLAHLYLLTGKTDLSAAELDSAEKMLGPARAESDAEIKYFRGKTEFAKGNISTAAANFNRALFLQKNAGNRHGEALVLIELSRISGAESELDLAVDQIEKAVEIVDRLRSSTFDFRERVNFTASVQQFYDQYLVLLMQRHKREPDGRFDYRAFEVSENARARGLLDQMERKTFIQDGTISSTILEKEHELFSRLNLLILSKTENAETAAAVTDTLSKLVGVELELSRAYKSAERAFAKKVEQKKLLQMIDKNSVMLEFWLTNSEAFLFAFADSRLHAFDLGNAEEINQLAKKIYRCYSQINSPLNQAVCKTDSERLSKILLSPVRSELKQKRIIAVKHGALNYIPLSALPDPQTGRFLAQDHEIVSLPSLAVLGHLVLHNDRSGTGKIGIFADPVYSTEDGRFRGKRAGKPKVANVPRRLFATAFESAFVASSFPAENVVKRTGFEASRANLFSIAEETFSILHFAAHVSLDDKDPELSAILLSGIDKTGAPRNNSVYLNEILRLNLKTDLVVLSSCESGIGKTVRGEGMISFANTFFAAGADRLVTSLWKVDDKVTAEFMKRFYRGYAKEDLSAASALRQAQLEIMADPRWNSPYYWSAFTLQGLPD